MTDIFVGVYGNDGRVSSWILLRWSDDSVADGEAQDCLKGEMVLDCFDYCLFLFGAITASISCLNFRLVSSRLGFALISSSGICS